MRRAATPRTLWITSAILAGSLGSEHARASTASLVTELECKGLDEDARGAFDARARAELTVRGVSEAAVVVVCSEAGVDVVLRTARSERSRTIPYAKSWRETIEDCLSTLNELAAATDEPTNRPPRRLAVPVAESEASTSSEASSFGRAPSSFWRLGMTAGADTEVGWRGSMPGVVGGHFTFVLQLFPMFAVVLGGGVRGGLSSPMGLATRVFEGGAQGRIRFGAGAAWEVGTGLTLSSLSLENKRTDTMVSLPLRVGYYIPWGLVGFSIGPEARWYLNPVSVSYNDREQYHVGQVAAGLYLDVITFFSRPSP